LLCKSILDFIAVLMSPGAQPCKTVLDLEVLSMPKSSFCDRALPSINQDICCLSSGAQEWAKDIAVFSLCSAATGAHKSARVWGDQWWCSESLSNSASGQCVQHLGQAESWTGSGPQCCCPGASQLNPDVFHSLAGSEPFDFEPF